jgi:cardiolipin synthase (CMP-forming)
MMRKDIWTISNIISLSRIILMIPAGYFLSLPGHFHREIAVLIILLAVSTDALDGYLARKLNQVSEMGKIIDPLADKIGVGIVVVMMTIFGDIPLWFTVAVLARDVIIFLAGIYIKTKTGIVLPSTMAGKVAVSFLALYLVLAMLRYPSITILVNVIFVVSLSTLAFSLAVYARRFVSTLKEHSPS